MEQKEQLAIKVTKIAQTCKSFTELHTKLIHKKIEPYYKYGTLTGVWFGNKKYRLTTLGVGKEHLHQLSQEDLTMHNQKITSGIEKKKKDLDKLMDGRPIR